jgi:hypothetical protein
VTIRLAGDGPQTVRADSIGAAWLAVAGRILDQGVESRYDGLPVREISLVMTVKSAHVYETEAGYLREVLEEYR